MDNSLEEQAEHVSMPEHSNSFEECCSKPTEEYTDNSNPNHSDTSAEEFVHINNRNENWCNDAGTVPHDKKEATEKHSVMDLLVKLGNDTAVYNISKSLERVRYIINCISVEDILSSLPHQRCVTYISEAQKTIKENQKGNVFKFVSSYPCSYNLRKYRVKTGMPVIIIGDVTNIQEDHCSYVFICAYMNEVAADESSDSSDDGSSSVDSSEDSTSSDFSSSDENEGENNEKTSKIVNKCEDSLKPIKIDVRNPLVFLEDGAADKLPPVRECDIKVPKQDCIEIGNVMHIHKLLISVQGLKDSPALNADTLLFLEDNEDNKSLQSLGFIYEVIGPVGEPVYCITFKEEKNIEKKQVKQGASVYIYPSSEHTHFVFVQDLLKQKGSDASWKNDVEPPEQFIEYSDDEQERLAKQRLKKVSSKESPSNAVVKRKNTEESNPEKAGDSKRIRVTENYVEVNKVGNGCMQSVGPQEQPGTVNSQHSRTGARRRGQQMFHVAQIKGEVANRRMSSIVPPGTSGNPIGSYCAAGRGQRILHAVQVNSEVGNRNMPSMVPPGTSDSQQNGIGSYCAAGRGQRILHAVQVNSEVGNRNMPSMVPPGTSDSQHNGIDSYCAPGRGQRILHAVQVNSEVGNRNIPSMVSPRTSHNQHNGIDSYCTPGRGQRILHDVQVNFEVGNRNMPSMVPPGTSDTQHNGIGSYCAAGRGQRMLRALQGNSVQPPRMQHYGFAQQPPPRMQRYTPAPAVNRCFMPVPPGVFPSNQHLTPPLQQRQAYFNPRCTTPFPSPQGRFHNPPQ